MAQTDNRGEGMNIKELESLDYKPKAPCSDCGLTDGTHMRGCKFAQVIQKPKTECSICHCIGSHLNNCPRQRDREQIPVLGSGVTITAQHARSLAALVRHWKKMIRYLGKENCELTTEYCDELLEDLGQ